MTDIRFVNVLDKGYVRLVDHMGSDLTVANTARVSFDREKLVFEDTDKKLVTFLVKNKHDSCLRHNVMTFEIYAPLMVARQWWKHTVASTHLDDQEGWNESSRRYLTENEMFYVPDHFLAAPENKKQGAGDAVDDDTNAIYRQRLIKAQEKAVMDYEEAMEAGIAPEQARLFLPAYGLYVRWRWTASLNALMNFFSLRLDGHAQSEIRAYANSMKPMVQQHFPITYDAWMEYRL